MSVSCGLIHACMDLSSTIFCRNASALRHIVNSGRLPDLENLRLTGGSRRDGSRAGSRISDGGQVVAAGANSSRSFPRRVCRRAEEGGAALRCSSEPAEQATSNSEPTRGKRVSGAIVKPPSCRTIPSGCIAQPYVGKPRQCEIHHRPASLCGCSNTNVHRASRMSLVCCVIRTQCCSMHTTVCMGRIPQIPGGSAGNISGHFVQAAAQAQIQPALEPLGRPLQDDVPAAGAGPVDRILCRLTRWPEDDGDRSVVPQKHSSEGADHSGQLAQLSAGDAQQDAVGELFHRPLVEDLLATRAAPVGAVERAGAFEETGANESTVPLLNGSQGDDIHSGLIRPVSAAVKLRRRTPTVGIICFGAV